MAELTQNEKRLLATLEKERKADAPHLAGLLEATPEALVQWACLLGDKGLVTIDRIVVKEFSCTEEGKTYAKNGLPETQLLRFILPGATLADLQKHEAFKIGFGQLRKKGLVKVEGTSVAKTPNASTDADEAALRNPSENDPRTKDLIKRGILQESETVRYTIAITPEGLALAKKGLDLREETGTLSREQILSGAWKTANLRRYDVTNLPKKAYPGKIHPYQRI
ncbi:MAG: phenylalanine--tRNA ligase subunit alpha, partial [Methanoregula sp.]